MWSKLSLFWKCQFALWAAFIVFSFPVKVTAFGSIGAAVVSLYRDGLGFLVTLGLHEIYRRMPSRQIRVIWTVVIIVILSFIGGLLQTLISLAIQDIRPFAHARLLDDRTTMGVFYHRSGLLMLWSILYFGFRLLHEDMELARRLSRAEASHRDAEVQMLRAQMEPHFLYNAFNAILADIEKPGSHLWSLVQSLAEYLRYSLANRKRNKVTLRQEVEAIKNYLTVEGARYRNELEIEWNIDEAALSALVPGVVIQPLIENAIKYGRKTSHKPCSIRLIISRPNSDVIRIEVANTGHWIEEAEKRSIGGVGLGNLRQRLAFLYPGRDCLQIFNEYGWVLVQVDIPVEP